MADDQSHAMVVVDEESKRREYRRGNWTPQETMILMEAKKMDNERRLRRGGGGGGGGEGSSSSGQSRPSELRWKWVEDYCWRLGCLRSQNQCNDKWDNLMRDYKKVRDYESRLLGSDDSSYWKLERHERKERGLPSNMLGQIYEAMAEIVERKGSSSVGASTAAAAAPLVQYVEVEPPPPPPLPPPLPPPPPTTTTIQASLPNHIRCVAAQTLMGVRTLAHHHYNQRRGGGEKMRGPATQPLPPPTLIVSWPLPLQRVLLCWLMHYWQMRRERRRGTKVC